MKKFIVLESYCGSSEDVYIIEANDIFEAYALSEEKEHNLAYLASITVYDLQEARKLALKIIKEVRNASPRVNTRTNSRKGCTDKLFAARS